MLLILNDMKENITINMSLNENIYKYIIIKKYLHVVIDHERKVVNNDSFQYIDLK